MIPPSDEIAKPAGSTGTKARPRITVAIATTGRPEILGRTVELLLLQKRRADAILICPARADDVASATIQLSPEIIVVRSNPGLPAQRNALLMASAKSDIVVFFDDDFFPEDTYLHEVETLFQSHPEVAMSTGTVVADGILGPGLAREHAEQKLAELSAKPSEALEDVHNGYGCNMAIRMSAAKALNIRFDENLPLYGWLEDVDFSRRLAFSGRIVRSNRLRGVHLGNKGGRTSGLRLGYSQVVNPLYMVRKGSLTWRWACVQISRNLVANTLKVLRPEPWIDRKGRLLGNIRGLTDAIRGQLDPRQILKM